MKKVLKWASILVVLLFLFFILTFICLVTFISPNRFKSVIAEKINEATGRQLIIEGDLSWTVFPTLGVKAGHMTLSNPPGFKQPFLAEIEHVTVGVKLVPLLRKKIESNGITLEGMKLHLIKKADGVANWNLNSVAQASEDTNELKTHKPQSETSVFAVVVNNFNITHSQITWINEKTKQTASIDNFNLHAKEVSTLHPVPYTTDFDFASSDLSSKGHVSLKAETALDMATKVFSFRKIDLNVKAEKGARKIKLTFNGDAMADLTAETLQVTNIKINTDDLKLTGQLHVTELNTSPTAKGHFAVAPFDMKKWLDDMGYDVSNMQTLKMVSGAIDVIPGKSMVLQGQFKIDTVELNNIKMNHVNVPIYYQNGMLDLKSVTGEFYQGTLKADSNVNFNKDIPQMALQTKLSGFNAGALMKDVGSKSKLRFTGAGNIDLNITANLSSFTRSLDGNGRFNFSSGVIEGMDIAYLINSAAAFIKKKSTTAENSGQTAFNDLSGSFTIHKGVFSNNDLSVKSTGFMTTGQGNVDLVNETINYHLKTEIDKSFIGSVINLTGITIPIIISGHMKNPSIGLDVGGFVKSVAEQQIKNISNVGSDVGDTVKNPIVIPEKAGKLLKNLFGH